MKWFWEREQKENKEQATSDTPEYNHQSGGDVQVHHQDMAWDEPQPDMPPSLPTERVIAAIRQQQEINQAR